MKNMNLNASVDKWWDKIYKHVSDAIILQKGYSQNKSTLNSFNLFFGKLVECIWYDRFIIEERVCTEPDFNLYIINSDGGVDLIIAELKNVSVKCRSLIHNKNAYFDKNLHTFNRQFKDVENIIIGLKNNNKKCDFIVGAIRYQTSLYSDWENAYANKDLEMLKHITKEIINMQMIWFTTEYGNIQIEF